MNTLDDLRSSLDRHADRAPDAFGLVEAARSGAARIRRRRRIVRAGVAAATVLIVAAGVPAVVRLRESGTAVAARAYHRTPSQTTLETVPGSGVAVDDLQSVGSVQFGYARSSARGSRGLAARIQVYDPGSFDPTVLQRGRRLTVGGRAAWFVTDYEPVTSPDRGPPVLGWQDRSGVWLLLVAPAGSYPAGTITADHSIVAYLTDIAAGLRIGPARDIPMPYRLGWLPAGVRMQSANTSPTAIDARSQLALTSDREPPSTGPASLAGIPDTAVAISTRPTTSKEWPGNRDADGKKRTTIAGHAAWSRTTSGKRPSREVAVEIGTCGLIIYVDETVVTFPELERLVGGITVADCGDPGTWGPVR